MSSSTSSAASWSARWRSSCDTSSSPTSCARYLQGLGAIHLAYGVVPSHYDAVGDSLLAALAQTAGKSWSEEEAEAWRGAFALIADAMLAGATKMSLDVEQGPSRPAAPPSLASPERGDPC